MQILFGMFEKPETWEEGTIAENLASGRGYTFEFFGTTTHAFRSPVYALILGGLYVLLGVGAWVAAMLNAILGVATALSAQAIGTQLGGVRAGLISGVLVGLHPGLLVYAAKVHQLSLDALLVTLTALLLVRSMRRLPLSTALCTGGIGGLIALSRPPALGLVLSGALALVRIGGTTPRAAARWIAVMLVVGGLIAGSWAVRNWFVVGAPILSSTTGQILWTGHNPNATGSTLTADRRAMIETDPEMRSRVTGVDELEQDRIFREAAFEYIRSDPMAFVRRVTSNAVAFWSIGPTTGTRYPGTWLIIYSAYYAMVLAAAAFGVGVLLRRSQGGAVLVLVGGAFATGAIQALFYVDGRHRWVIEPLLLVLSAIGCDALLRRVSPDRQPITRDVRS